VHQIPCRAAMNSVEWNPKYNLLAYAGDDKNKYQTDEGIEILTGFFFALKQLANLCSLTFWWFDEITLLSSHGIHCRCFSNIWL
jgi:hypothetical protein